MNNQLNPQELNHRVETILGMANRGMNPQSVMQQLFGRNSQYPQQLNQTMTQLNNMAEGRPLNEFMIQALRQSGLTEQNANGLARLLGMK